MRFRTMVKRFTGIGIRDSWFQIPPRFGWKFVLKLPLHVAKRLLVSSMGVETFSSVDGLMSLFREVRDGRRQGADLVIVPLFPVRPWLYGHSHNEAINTVNQRIRDEMGADVLAVPAGPHYVSDGFHWTEGFHQLIATALSERVPVATDRVAPGGGRRS